MIPNKEKGEWQYLAVKRRSTLLRGIPSKHYGYFYCLSCLYSFRTEKKLKCHEKIYKNKDFCGVLIPLKKDEILKFNQYIKSDKIPYIIYAGIDSLIKEK